MDFLRSHLFWMQLCAVDHLFLTFWRFCCCAVFEDKVYLIEKTPTLVFLKVASQVKHYNNIFPLVYWCFMFFQTIASTEDFITSWALKVLLMYTCNVIFQTCFDCKHSVTKMTFEYSFFVDSSKMIFQSFFIKKGSTTDWAWYKFFPFMNCLHMFNQS